MNHLKLIIFKIKTGQKNSTLVFLTNSIFEIITVYEFVCSTWGPTILRTTLKGFN